MVEQVQPNSDESSPETPVMTGALPERWLLWRTPAILTIALVAAVFAIFWQTSWSMVSIWLRSETFTHGFFILPISAFLIWQRRKDLARYDPAPNWWGIPVLIGIGVVWLIAHSASVLVLEQLAMMAMVPTLVWTVLGWQVTWAIAFPLAFLFFAVPMGEELIPYMMDFTANFTVAALQLTGIPRGYFFRNPQRPLVGGGRLQRSPLSHSLGDIGLLICLSDLPQSGSAPAVHRHVRGGAGYCQWAARLHDRHDRSFERYAPGVGC